MSRTATHEHIAELLTAVNIESGQQQQEGVSDSRKMMGMVASIIRGMEMMGNKLVLNDEKMRRLDSEIKSTRDENNSLKERIESIEREKEALTERVRQLGENLDREIVERGESDVRDDARATSVTEAIASNRAAMETEMEPVRGDIRSMKRNIESLKWQAQSARVAVGLGRGDASCDEWLIEEDGEKVEWVRTSDKFTGTTRPYTYQLQSVNLVMGSELWMWLQIWASPRDALLEWPFRGAVTVTITYMDRRDVCTRQRRLCELQRPPANGSRSSDPFVFPHAALRGAGLDLKRGVRVSCHVVPGAD